MAGAVSKPLRRESDMAAPITACLTAQGFTVRNEVLSCDITGVRDGELVVVEMKRSFSTDLLIQAVDRQRVADTVYVAVPIEGTLSRRDRYAKRWKGIETLCKRLSLGLMIVCFPPDDTEPCVEIVLHPVDEPTPRRKPKRRQAILREIAGRTGDYNTGGGNNRTILTAYREQAIFIACGLDKFGALSPTGCRNLGCAPKAGTILRNNVYGWFERIGRGLYRVRPGVMEHIAEQFPHVVAHYTARLDTPYTIKC